jgi:hypothetical protein
MPAARRRVGGFTSPDGPGPPALIHQVVAGLHEACVLLRISLQTTATFAHKAEDPDWHPNPIKPAHVWWGTTLTETRLAWRSLQLSQGSVVADARCDSNTCEQATS